MSSSSDAASLRSDLEELKKQLVPQLARDEKRVKDEGRPFNPLAWIAGEPDTRRYPAGPAFVPVGPTDRLTWGAAFASMDSRDVLTTLAGAGAAYALGFANAKALGGKSGHRLGFWLAIPAIGMGLLAGTRNGVHRYLGLSDNGNPSLYPGYVEDAAPYFLKHNVSERHHSVSPDLHLDARDDGTAGQRPR